MDDKKLLLTDLSARFPHNVALNCKDEYDDKVNFTCYLTSDILRQLAYDDCMWTYKPYLYPLSSMTEEQKKELKKLYWNCDNYEISNDIEYVYHNDCFILIDCFMLIDWLNKNHLDYRGLIEKGLAIDCTNLNIY